MSSLWWIEPVSLPLPVFAGIRSNPCIRRICVKRYVYVWYCYIPFWFAAGLPFLHGHCQGSSGCAHSIECLGNIANRVQNHVVLSVEIGDCGQFSSLSVRKERQSMNPSKRNMLFSALPIVWYVIFLSVRCSPWNIGCGFHICPICSEKQWRNTVCRCWWSVPHGILFSPVPYLSPFPAGKRAGQEKTAVRCQAAGNSAWWQIACEKRKT